MIPSAVLFDFDGTLADSEPLITESMVVALGRHGYEVTAERVQQIFGPPLDTMLRMLVSDLSDDEVEAIRTSYFADYNGRQLPRIQSIDGANELLDALDAHHVALALVTNKFEASAHRQLEAMHWEGRFALVVGADTTSLPKPAAEPALYALERLGVAPAQAAFVGDQDPDVACGLAAGIPMVVGVAFGRSAESLAAAGATHVARDLHEVRALLLDGAGG